MFSLRQSHIPGVLHEPPLRALELYYFMLKDVYPAGVLVPRVATTCGFFCNFPNCVLPSRLVDEFENNNTNSTQITQKRNDSLRATSTSQFCFIPQDTTSISSLITNHSVPWGSSIKRTRHTDKIYSLGLRLLLSVTRGSCTYSSCLARAASTHQQRERENYRKTPEAKNPKLKLHKHLAK